MQKAKTKLRAVLRSPGMLQQSIWNLQRRLSSLPHRVRLGAMGEQATVRYLKRAEHHIMDRNWRNKFGELDIVSRHGSRLHITEVKSRTADSFDSESPLTQRQIRALKITAFYYVKKNIGYLRRTRIRFVHINLSLVLVHGREKSITSRCIYQVPFKIFARELL